MVAHCTPDAEEPMLEAGNRGDKQSRYRGVRVTWQRTGMELGGSYD
jgi:hypothetical protein